MPTIQISVLFKTQEANESECFEKNCSESSHENVCSGIYFLSNYKGGIFNFSKNVLSSACQLFSLVESIFYQTEKVE